MAEIPQPLSTGEYSQDCRFLSKCLELLLFVCHFECLCVCGCCALRMSHPKFARYVVNAFHRLFFVSCSSLLNVRIGKKRTGRNDLPLGKVKWTVSIERITYVVCVRRSVPCVQDAYVVYSWLPTLSVLLTLTIGVIFDVFYRFCMAIYW